MTQPRADKRRATTEREDVRATMPIRTYAECAAILGCSISAVHKSESNALRKIRKGLIELGAVDETGKIICE